MEEVFPVLAGVVVGLALHPIASKWLRAVIMVVGSIGFGAVASWMSGEIAVSSAYLLIDTAQVFGAGALTVGLVVRWRRRASYRVRI